jgi:hypothetical protein
MPYLLRLQSRPTLNGLSEEERSLLERRFAINAREVSVDGETFELDYVDEVEVAVAARAKSPAGWLVKNLLFGGERYHVGIYAAKRELVLPNITLAVARYVVQNVAFFARNSVRYKGVEDISPVTES